MAKKKKKPTVLWKELWFEKTPKLMIFCFYFKKLKATFSGNSFLIKVLNFFLQYLIFSIKLAI
jgi:hypothetical protein